MDWDFENASILGIGGAASIPVGDKIHSHVSVGAETFEILRTGKYVVLEGEVGSHRVRAGKLAPRTWTGIDFNTNQFGFSGGHGYLTGDGPLHVSKKFIMLGQPTLTFTPTSVIRSTGSWVTDGFVGGFLPIQVYSPLNSGNQLATGVSTTTNPDDTLNIFGAFNAEVTSEAYVSRGTLTVGIDKDTNYWVIVDGPQTVRLATSRENALAGVAVDISSGNSIDFEDFGGDQGPNLPVGFAPMSPSENTVRGEGEKLVRAGEQIIVNASAITVRSQNPGDILKWWSVG